MARSCEGCSKDGKSLYVVRGGKLLTINTDHEHLAMFEGEFLKSQEGSPVKEDLSKTTLDEAKTNEDHSQNLTVVKKQSMEKDNKEKEETPDVQVCDQASVDGSVHVIGEVVSEAVVAQGEEVGEAAVKVKKNDTIRFKRNGSSEWSEGKVISRAGKVGSKYDKWWNIRDIKTGHIQPEDFANLKELQRSQLKRSKAMTKGRM